MADPSDMNVQRFVRTGTQTFLIHQTYRSRIGYRGPRQYDEVGNLLANPVNYLVYQINCRPRVVLPEKSPLDGAVTKEPGYFLGMCGISYDELLDRATKEFYGKAANTNALLPLMLKERQQTIDMVTEKVMKLVAFKRKFLKEIRKSWKRNDHKIVQERWLEYRYGWLPTLMDIDTLINKPLGLPSAKCEGKAFVRYDSDDYVEGEYEFSQYGSFSTRVSATLVPRDPFMKTATQYGITNPSLVLWEMVPYSFVVDWVFDVGGYLEHLGALNGLRLVNPTHGYRHSFGQQCYTPARLPTLSSSFTSFRGRDGKRFTGVPSYPNPFIPNNGMNLVRFFDAAALLKGQFDRFRR